MEQGRRRGRLPDRVANKPEVPDDLALYWSAYCDLDSCRPRGFSVGPIPWTAIWRYAEVHGFDPDQFDSLIYIAGKMDRAYMKKQESKSGGGKSRAPTVRPPNVRSRGRVRRRR